ncbi:MAG: metallophosphoesterase family protein [Sandaracinaceae bacterium]
MTRSILILTLLLVAGCEETPAVSDDAGTDAGTGPADAGFDAAPSPEECQAEPGPGPAIPDPGTPTPGPVLDCGVPEIVDGTSLWRWPYLESATGTSVRVAWTTRNTGGRGVVRFAPGPAGPWTEIEAATELFEATRTAQGTDYMAYDATLSSLSPGTAYCYEIVEDGEVLARNLRFETAWSGTERPVRMLVIGDSGSGSENQYAVRDAFMTQDFDIFLHMGDMAYGSGRYDEFEANFFDVYQDLMHRVPVFPTIGNHEYVTNVGRPYRDVYHTLENVWRDEDRELYYSFDYGNIHFTALDSNEATLIPIYLDTNDRMTDDMFDWMIDDITSSDAEWKIVFMHHPFYSSSERGIRTNNIVRFRSLLEQAGVDLILVGHDHHYERTHPLLNGCTATEPDGVTEIIAGGSGASIRTIETDGWFSATAYNADYSYLMLEVHGCGLHGQAFNTANEVVDDFELNGCDP